MDTQQVEAIIRQQQQPPRLWRRTDDATGDFHDLTIAKSNNLSAKSAKAGSRFSGRIAELIRVSMQTPDNTTATARFERDLEEFYRQFNEGPKTSPLYLDNRSYVAARATEALNAVASVVSPRCSVASSKVS